MAISDGLRIAHMRDALRATMRLTSGRTREDLASDEFLQLALARAVEILCEAATQISAGTKGRYPDFPWRSMAALRNRLAHAYFDVNLTILWDIATQDAPNILPQVDEMANEIEP